jgi:hypothetical protein
VGFQADVRSANLKRRDASVTAAADTTAEFAFRSHCGGEMLIVHSLRAVVVEVRATLTLPVGDCLGLAFIAATDAATIASTMHITADS